MAFFSKYLVVFTYLLPTLLGSGGLHLIAPASHHCHLHEHGSQHVHIEIEHEAQKAASCCSHQPEACEVALESHSQPSSSSDQPDDSHESGEPCFLCDYVTQQAWEHSPAQWHLEILTAEISPLVSQRVENNLTFAPQCMRGPPSLS